jgi:hypothetical protein
MVSVAADILAQKYLRKRGIPVELAEESSSQKRQFRGTFRLANAQTTQQAMVIRQVAHRLAGAWTWWAGNMATLTPRKMPRLFTTNSGIR